MEAKRQRYSVQIIVLSWIFALTVLGLARVESATAASFPYSGTPFKSATAEYLGTSIGGVRGYPYYDLQPSVMYEPSDPARKFKMWWLGRFRPGDADLPPYNLEASDRIYFSYSADGQVWSTPQVVLKGLAGAAGVDKADDHLVGSPSVMRVGGTYYMFYEAYGNWTTTIVRSWSSQRADSWVTSGLKWDVTPHESYAYEYALGIAPSLPKAGTIPIYSGYVVYPSGKINHFLDRSTARCSQGVKGSEYWFCRHEGKPIFWLYTSPGPNRVPLYECFDIGLSNTFVTNDPGCDGHGVPGAPDGGSYLLGYAAAVTPSPHGQPVAQTAADMAHSNQNRIMLATSPDGVNWSRFTGAEAGGAVIAPQHPYTTAFPNNCGTGSSRDVASAYGSGYPVALERDGFLELYFTDDSQSPVANCARDLGQWRIRIPMSEIGNSAAYASATRQANAPYGDDMKWSPLRRRYFVAFREWGPGDWTQPGFLQSPMLQWSEREPNPAMPAAFPAEPDSPSYQLYRAADESRLPVNWPPTDFTGRLGGVGGLAGDALGHTLDFETADPNDPPGTIEYSAYHIYYQAQTNSVAASHWYSDLDHVLVFGWGE